MPPAELARRAKFSANIDFCFAEIYCRNAHGWLYHELCRFM